MPEHIHIVIPVLGNVHWTGGYTYQSNLEHALQKVDQVSFSVEENLDSPRSGLSRLGLMLLHKVSLVVLGYNYPLTQKLNRIREPGINVLFTNNLAHLFARTDYIKLYWIPDFQHFHLPALFGEKDLLERNHQFEQGCIHADAIVLSSKDAQDDLATFNKQFVRKSYISSPVAFIPDAVWNNDPLVTTRAHSLPEKFLYLPNQFWTHKNHELVFRAMALLRNQGTEVQLVCSGNLTDYRNTSHFASLKKLIADLGIEPQVHILGMLTHDEVLQLLRQSVAIINPSLFEGWSTTVEESKSLGKRCLLSSIDVHKEQAPSNASYFDPADPVELANLMRNVWENEKAGPDPVREKEAREHLDERMQAWGMRFVEIVQTVRNGHQVPFKGEQSVELPALDLPLETPVLFMIFNRPETTRQVFDAIQKARPKHLFIVADGPRADRAGEKELCEKARAIATAIDWDCEVRTLFRDHNMGCGLGPADAITWFFSQVEEGIILEDDCIPDPSFFSYCTELLNRYRNDERVMHISGNNFVDKDYSQGESYYFNYYFTAWGWATWRRAWEKYHFTIPYLDEFLSSGQLREITMSRKQYEYWSKIFNLVRNGKRADIWDYQWILTCWYHRALAVTPVKNLVMNVGFGSDATHTIDESRVSFVKSERMNVVRHPVTIQRNKEVDQKTFIKYFAVPQHLNKIRVVMYNILPNSVMLQMRKIRRKYFPDLK